MGQYEAAWHLGEDTLARSRRVLDEEHPNTLTGSWPTRYRPGSGTRDHYRITMRHGVSVLHSGRRHALGVIFHDTR